MPRIHGIIRAALLGLCLVAPVFGFAAAAAADDLTDEELDQLDETGKVSFSYEDDDETVDVTVFRHESQGPPRRVEYVEVARFTSEDGETETQVTILSEPDPFVGYRLQVRNSGTQPVGFDAFATMPILPITGSAGAAPRVMGRVDVTLSDTGGDPGVSLRPLFFPNMFETFVGQTEEGGLTDAGAGLGGAPITTEGTTSLTIGPRDGPNPATDPTVDAWNYMTPFINVELSPGDTAEIIGVFSMVETGQQFPDPEQVFARLRAVPEPSALALLTVLGLLPLRRRPCRYTDTRARSDGGT